MDVEEVLNQLYKRYANCATYRDQGYLSVWDEHIERTFKPQLVFRTYFEQPDKFRFEWQDNYSQCLIWCDGTHSYYCSDYHDSGPEKQLCESPEMAIARATGVSMGSASVVPGLLFAEYRDKLPLLESNIKLIKTERIDDHECYCIQGSRSSPNDTIVWISTHDFSLRRYEDYMLPWTEEELSTPVGPSREQMARYQSRTNLIGVAEGAEFRELFPEATGLVEEKVFDGNLFANRKTFTSITYAAIEFDALISPKIFNRVQRDETELMRPWTFLASFLFRN